MMILLIVILGMGMVSDRIKIGVANSERSWKNTSRILETDYNYHIQPGCLPY